MTNREYFAAKAMQGTIANPSLLKYLDDIAVGDKRETKHSVAIFSLQMADALIAELNKVPK